jgi:hypothetical protein
LKKAKNKFTTIYGDNFDCIPYIILVRSLAKYGKNNFINSLIQLFGNAITNALIELYKLGTANSLKGELSFGKLIRKGGQNG